MGRFNLVDEPWISVIVNDKGDTELVSLKKLFQNAHNYKAISGDSPVQDFAVMRVLLAILHTVFSRFDAEGIKYEYVELDEKMQQIKRVDEDDYSDYLFELKETWEILWNMGGFPDIISKYLEIWHDRFYLFDDKYPFFQVREEEVSGEAISRDNASTILGKNLNRLISESANKVAMFSPKYDKDKNKEKLSADEVARWLITFQGYTGLSDKVIFGKEKYKASKGWLFDIGGIFLSGNNIFETLMFNFALIHPVEQYNNEQKPCWEFEPEEIIRKYFSESVIDNNAELYTNWSRAIFIDPNVDLDSPFEMQIVKLPDINHENQFTELMTIWRYNKVGENKEKFTPRKHEQNKSMWRSFGLITQTYKNIESKDETVRKPGIMDWLSSIEDIIGDIKITINAVSMQDDGNATSWVPTDEIVDYLSINEMVITDLSEDGWVDRINDTVEETKNAIGFTYRKYISDLKDIRNTDKTSFVNDEVEEMYYLVDKPFRDWISSIKVDDSKDEKIFQWRGILKPIMYQQAKKLAEQGSSRDYTGIVVGEKVKNIATAFNEFSYWLNRNIKLKNEEK